MKKILLFASALAGLFLAASCQQENLEPEQMAGAVKFTVEAPGAIATKTIADGQNVDVVHYAVYKTKSDETHAIEVSSERPLAQGFVPMSGKRANINFDLLQDQYYTIIFWAQVSQYDNGQNDYYDLGDLRAISMKKDAQNNIAGNEEGRAAFFAWYSFDTKEHKDHVVTLKRPFAQLNLLTTLESLKPVSTGQTSGYEIAIEKSTVTVQGLTSTFYPYAQPVLPGTQGKAEETNETFTFTLEDTPAVQGIGEGDNKDLLHVNGKAYHYVSMNYFFVPLDAYTVDISYILDTDKGNVEHAITAVPVKKNYRTNVIGNLLTKESKFEIIVDEKFAGDVAPVDVWDGREVSEPAIVDGKYVISTAAELAWLSAAVNGTLPPVAVNGVAQPTPKPQTFNGKTFMLLEDINLDNPSIELPNVTWTPIGATGKFEGTFDGNGKTIRGLKVVAQGKASAGLFANAKYVKNVTVDGAQITGQYKTGVIVGDGLCSRIDDCHVINSTVTVTPYNQDEANNVGGIVGYLSAENEAWVKGCTVENTTISAYRKVGGIAGTANQAAVVTGNTVKNSFVIADQTPEYKEVKAADLGEIVGYVHAKATVRDNSAENVELTYKVNSVEELNNAADGAFVTLGAGVYNLTDDVTIANMPVQVREGEVVINGQGYKITSGSEGNYAIITKGDDSSLTMHADVVSYGGGYGVTGGANLTIDGGLIDVRTEAQSGRYNIYAVDEGTFVTVNGGTFKFDTSKQKRRAYIYAGAGATVLVKGGTFGKPSTSSNYKAGIMGDGTVIVTGGTFGFDPTKWVAAGYSAKKDDAKQTWTVVSLTEGDNLKEAVAAPGATVKLAAGEYTFPSSSIAEGVTIECEPGTVFTGNSKLNIKGSTVIGATFSNPSGTAVDQTINGTFKNCTFTGKNAVYYGYAGETCYFENCVFSGDTYGFHFDGGANDAYFKNCTFSGFNAFGAEVTLVTFEGCKFVANGKSGYNGANLWGSAKMINTEFIFDGTTANEWVDCIGADKTYEFTGCTINDGTILSTYYFGSRSEDTDITIDGVLYEDFAKTAYLACAKDMFWFADKVNVEKNAFNGKTVKLAANIDLKNAAWTPVGQTGATTFNGVFDGQNYTISNLNVNSEAQTGAHYSSGLFGWVESHTAGHGHIKNVKIAGATVAGHHNCGALVGYITQQTALVENCHVTGANITCTKANNDADGDKAGALIGNATVATPVKDCTAANSTVSAGRDAGQVIGAGKEANVTGCSATNVTVSANGTSTGNNVRNEVIGRLL